jgi:RpiR family carbohydrate utilization transcriptional regulator
MELFKPEMNPILKLRAIYPSLRDSEKKVADYIQANSNEIIYLSIGNLAEKCGVSEASIIRLCKAIKFSGYQELKINIAKFFIEPEKYIHEDAKENDSINEIIRKVMTSDIKAIEDTLKTLDAHQVESAVKALSNANRIEFYGLGGSGVVAFDAQHKFFKYGIHCIAYNDPHMQIMSASLLHKGDVVVGISHSGSTKDLVNSLSEASKAGATTICITSSMKSPITKASDYTLLVLAKEQLYKTEPMASRIAQLAVIDVLSVGVSLRRKNLVVENLDKARKALISKRF